MTAVQDRAGPSLWGGSSRSEGAIHMGIASWNAAGSAPHLGRELPGGEVEIGAAGMASTAGE